MKQCDQDKLKEANRKKVHALMIRLRSMRGDNKSKKSHNGK